MNAAGPHPPSLVYSPLTIGRGDGLRQGSAEVRGTARIALAAVVLLSAATVVILGTRRLIEGQRATAEINRLREELYRARVASDRCRSALVTSESSLLTLTVTIDSLRNRVDSFEALGGGRVPADRYDEYLAIFNSYNDSVAAWETRSERLRTADASCRSVIEAHNAISDSIQQVLVETGLADG